MPTHSKISAYTTLITLIIGVVSGVAMFYTMPLLGASASERRPIAVFGEDVARTLAPMLDENRTKPLTASDAKTITSLKRTYDKLQRNKSNWHADTTPPDAPFFKTLAQYDADKMSAFKQTTLLASARYDVNRFVDETKAFNQASIDSNVTLRIVFSTVVALVVGFFSGLFAHEYLTDHYMRKNNAGKCLNA